jgi:hypothetical protein
MRSITKLFTMAAMVWAGIVVGLMGCDRTLTAPDPISPKANMQITSIRFGADDTVLLAPLAGGTSNTTGDSVAFPEPQFEVQIFNAISVELRDFRVDYFAEDGVTPLGTRPFAGPLHRFVDGGEIPDAGLTTIAPGSAVPPADPIEAGAPGRTTLIFPVVSAELRSFLAGPDGRFRAFAEDTSSIDDFRGNVIARVRIRGADINGNLVEAVANLTVNSLPLVDAGQGGG